MDTAKHRHAPMQQSQGAAPNGDPTGKIGGAIQRIHYPTPLLLGKNVVGLLAQITVIGVGSGNGPLKSAIRPLVRRGYQAAVGF
jgi:hypothetical protein